MFKDKIIRRILFGKHNELKYPDRVVKFIFPKADEEDIEREIIFKGEDGLILYLLKRIEKLENKIK